jgi:hypothetical protein
MGPGMGLPHFLYNAAVTAQIAGAVIVLYYLYPAYKRTKNKGLACIGFGYMLALFLKFFSFLIPSKSLGSSYYWYYNLIQLVFIAELVAFPVGFIMLLRSWMRLEAALTLTCPKCGTGWELTSREAAQPLFICPQCDTPIDTGKETGGRELGPAKEK